MIAGLKNHPVRGKRFLLPRSDIADAELTQGIKKLGARVHEVAAYRTVPVTEDISQARDMLLSNQIDVITFTSSSTVTNLIAVLKEERPLNDTMIACIGPKTADTATKASLKVDIVAQEHTIPGLVAAIEDYFRKET